ncbi:hypothetical protein BLIC30S_03424 [Bacillus licheniformis]
MIYAKIYVRPPEFMGWSLKLRLSYIRIYLHFLNRKEEKNYAANGNGSSIKEMSDTKEEIKKFAEEWHQYSTGDASMRLLNFMSEHMTANEKRPAGS